LGRILAIDYGKKRTGVAVTDPLQIIAGGLVTVSTEGIWNFLDDYLKRETVDTIVVGKPLTLNNRPSESFSFIEPFVRKLERRYPRIRVERMDERFTSSIAGRAMIEGGMKKKDRQEKERIDRISASLILQSYMEMKKNKTLK